MIDWYPVFSNALWVIGLAILFAKASFQNYLQKTDLVGENLLASKEIDWISRAGLLLFCFGLLLTSDRIFVKIIWGGIVLSILFHRMLSGLFHHLKER